MGLAGAVKMPVATALLLDLAPPERRQSVLALNYTVISVAYTLAREPGGLRRRAGLRLLAATSAAGYLLVAALYGFALRGPLPLERAPQRDAVRRTRSPYPATACSCGFAALAFVFPFSMGQVVTASPLFARRAAWARASSAWCSALNSILVAALALPVAARMEGPGPFRLLGAAALLVAAVLRLLRVRFPDAATALIAGTIVFSFGELIFSSAVPAAVARLAPAGRRGAYQGGWTLVASFSMGSALFVSGLLRDAAGWRGAWAIVLRRWCCSPRRCCSITASDSRR